MRFGRSLYWGAVAALASGFLALLVGADRLTQPTGGDAGPPSDTAPPRREERLLTSDNPGNHSILNSLFRRLLGGAKSEKLFHSGSEVWIVPHSKLANLEEKLVSLGVKFAVLREDWNHILRRNKAPMSTEQKEQLARAKESTGMVSVRVMRAPETAVAEYALTETPEQGNSTIIVPISDDRQVALVRATAKRTDRGVIWKRSPIPARPQSCSGGTTAD
jgi:hypothetical protein